MIGRIQAISQYGRQKFVEAGQKMSRVPAIAKRALRDLAASFAWWHAPLLAVGSLPFTVSVEVGTFSVALAIAVVGSHWAVRFLELRK